MRNPLDEVLGLPSPAQSSVQNPSIVAVIQSASKMAGVPPDIAMRLVNQESSFNPHAKSPVGAMGLTQLMPDTAKQMGVTDPYNPAENAAGGFKYLASLNRQFGGNWSHALAAYNWGPGNVEAWLQRGGDMSQLPAETRAYVAKIAPQHVQHLTKKRDFLQLTADRVKGSNSLDAALGLKKQHANPLDSYLSSRKSAAPNLPSPQQVYGAAGAGMASLNPMDSSGGDPSLAGPQNYSGLAQIAGHQDFPFIVHNAQLRDASSGKDESVLQLLRDPNSETFKAFHLYLKNPAQAMDQYGMGSPIQNQWMAKHGKGPEQQFSQFMDQHSVLNGINTFVTEQANPMAWAEGGIAGKLAGWLGKSAHAIPGAGGLDAAQTAAHAAGVGSPLYGLANRGGTEASQWAKGLIASIKVPEHLTRQIAQQIFGGLSNAEQREVVRLSQGLQPDPQFFKQYVSLKQRADALRNDVKHTTNEQIRTKVLDPKQGQVHNADTYFPMSNAYDFGPQHELEEQLRGGLSPGGGSTANKPKTFRTLDDALRSGNVDEAFSPATNYSTWRRQRLQRVAFEDAMERAPESLRRNLQASDYRNSLGHLQEPWQRTATQTKDEALQQTVAENNAKFGPGHPERFNLEDNKQYVAAFRALDSTPSAVLKGSMIAPELVNFLKNDSGLRRYIGASGSQLPGNQKTFAGKFVGLMRNMIVSNFLYHPMVNISGNDAAARGLHNLGGPAWEAGGYAYNAAKSVALQFGLLKPKDFLGGAQQYSTWMDRALKAGGLAEFGSSSKSALGGDAARVLTESNGKWKLNDSGQTWLKRMDKVATNVSNFNMDRTFREKGEEAFAVSLFRDAVEKGGLSDYDAGKVVRQALGDYYSFDPKSPWSSAFMFMPWLKSNTKFWMNVLIRKPQYVTGTSHATRNYNVSQNAPELQSPFPANDFMVHPKGSSAPWSPPFVGRDLQHIAQAAYGAATDGPGVPLTQALQMLTARGNPIARFAMNASQTADAVYAPNVEGPETNFSLIFNPKAPKAEQFKQVGQYFAGHFLPVPLVGIAVQNALRRGMDARDLYAAFASAAGLGFPGSDRLSDDQRRALKQAQRRYQRAYDQFVYNGRNASDLQTAWNLYISDLHLKKIIK